ncbi:MAG: hypothetical protein QOF15_4308, partial [Mycobacterium sp.]|nr:hypothetical protein [Mycobacterium sp.]
HIDGGADQVLGAQLYARRADREDLGVCGRIIGLRYLIGAFSQNFAVPDDHRREGAPSFGDVPAGEIDGPLGEVGHLVQGSRAGFGSRCDIN